MAAASTIQIYRPDPAPASEVQRCGRATFAVRHPSSTRVAVAVLGDIDASNGRALGRFVEENTRVSKQLVLDLRAVNFFGTQGFKALYYVSVHCARSDVDWMIVSSHPVRRVLSICDPDGELPQADDLPSALERLDRAAQCHHAWAG